MKTTYGKNVDFFWSVCPCVTKKTLKKIDRKTKYNFKTSEPNRSLIPGKMQYRMKWKLKFNPKLRREPS